MHRKPSLFRTAICMDTPVTFHGLTWPSLLSSRNLIQEAFPMNQTHKLHLSYLYQTAHGPVKYNPAVSCFLWKPGLCLPLSCIFPPHPVHEPH